MELYTDGSCLNGRLDDWWAGFGFVLVFPNKKILAAGLGAIPNGTNNVAELSAVVSGMSWLLKRGFDNSKITVVSDSRYTINCFNKFRWTWEKHNYLSREGYDIKNKELIIHGCNLLDEFRYYPKFRWVKGHSGDRFNELADKLAMISRKRHISPIAVTKRDRLEILLQSKRIDDAVIKGKRL